MTLCSVGTLISKTNLISYNSFSAKRAMKKSALTNHQRSSSCSAAEKSVFPLISRYIEHTRPPEDLISPRSQHRTQLYREMDIIFLSPRRLTHSVSFAIDLDGSAGRQIEVFHLTRCRGSGREIFPLWTLV